jgi:hypothetical protein
MSTEIFERLNIDLDKMTKKQLDETASTFEGCAQRIYCYIVDNASDIDKRK